MYSVWQHLIKVSESYRRPLVTRKCKLYRKSEVWYIMMHGPHNWQMGQTTWLKRMVLYHTVCNCEIQINHTHSHQSWNMVIQLNMYWLKSEFGLRFILRALSHLEKEVTSRSLACEKRAREEMVVNLYQIDIKWLRSVFFCSQKSLQGSKERVVDRCSYRGEKVGFFSSVLNPVEGQSVSKKKTSKVKNTILCLCLCEGVYSSSLKHALKPTALKELRASSWPLKTYTYTKQNTFITHSLLMRDFECDPSPECYVVAHICITHEKKR